jgi:hypothetical protein
MDVEHVGTAAPAVTARPTVSVRHSTDPDPVAIRALDRRAQPGLIGKP